ncbi:glycosyltransferase family 4 protein [Bacillus cereus]
MNVLLLMDKLVTGGAEMYFVKLENTISNSQVNLYTAAGNGDLYERIKHKSCFSMLSRKNHFANLLKIARIVKEKKIELIHANCLRVALYAVLLKFFIPSLKIIYTKHNVTILEKKYRKLFVNILNKYINSTITVSDYEKDNLVQMGVHQQKVTTIHNGVDLTQFQFVDKEAKKLMYKVGILARLSPEKNHSLFLKIANLLKEHRDIKFYIAGDGVERQKIEQEINDLDISHNVELLGNVSTPQHFIKDMNVLVLTSFREVFPMTILEAMAVGTSVISIDVGGIKEAIAHGENGYLIKDYNEQEFAERILYLKENKHIEDKFICVSREKVEKDFSLEKMVDKVEEQYLNCI